jgi:hypothetical protein
VKGQTVLTCVAPPLALLAQVLSATLAWALEKIRVANLKDGPLEAVVAQQVGRLDNRQQAQQIRSAKLKALLDEGVAHQRQALAAGQRLQILQVEQPDKMRQHVGQRWHLFFNHQVR